MSNFSHYYHRDLEALIHFLVTPGQKYTVINEKGNIPSGVYDYIFLLNTFSYIDDIQSYVKQLRKHCHANSKIVVVYYNFLWKPVLDFATFIKIREKPKQEQNWLSMQDIADIFYLENLDFIKSGKRMIFPFYLWGISVFFNKFLAKLPIVNFFCLTTYQIFRLPPAPKEYSVSIIIPARNEEGNMKGILRKIPVLGKKTEVIFVEGHSSDKTYAVIENEIQKYSGPLRPYLYKQKGVGKGDAVRLGFSQATQEVVIILDADLTVPPAELKKFYQVLSAGLGEFVNGSRLVYPMERQAMRSLNYFANKLFSVLFSYLLDQKIRDTLCGTKVLFRKDYLQIAKNRKFFGEFDPFGDFDLLFGAAKLNLKIIEIPIKYRERTYGKTNISRFRHGILLMRMTLFAAKKIKFT